MSRTRHRALEARYQSEQQRNAKERQALQQRLQAERVRADEAKRTHALALRGCASDLEAKVAACAQKDREIAALEAGQAKLLRDRGAVQLRGDALTRTHAALLAKERRLARVAQHFTALQRALKAQVQKGELWLERRAEHSVIVIPTDPLFSLGEAQLSSTGMTLLGEVGKAIRASYAPTPIRIAVQGHTDNVPKRTATIRNNWDLCAERALAVVERFIKAGIDPQRLHAASFGSFKPTENNTTRQGRARNRRLEVVIVPLVLPGRERRARPRDL